jgi:small-conductance mechanosensitive channel
MIYLLIAAPAAQAKSVRSAAKPQAPAVTASLTAPVLLHGKPVFQVVGFGAYSAAARAAAITQRLAFVSKERRFNPASIIAASSNGVSTVTANGLVLMTVTPQDAKALGKSPKDAAAFCAGQLRDAFDALRHPATVRTILLGALYSIIATVILFFLFRFLRLLYRNLRAKLDAWRGSVIPSLRIQKYELVPADRIANFLILVLRIIALAVSLILLYAWVSLVLGFFPQTRGYSRTLIHYITSTLNTIGNTVVHYLPNVFTIIIFIIIASYLIRFTRVIFGEIGKGNITFSGFHREWAEPTYKIVRFLILAATAIVIFPYLPGSNSPAFKGISIFLGVLFSLGSTSAVANLVAGVILTYMRAFRLGDRVQIADTVGDVIEISLLVTRIRTIKNVEITIANSMVLSSHIVNFSGSIHEHGLILHTTVTIGYDAPWRKVHELLIDAAQATEGIVAHPTPFVLQTALDDFYVHYQINAYTHHANQMATIYSRLHQNIQDKFYEGGVEIMSPHFSTIRDGNRIAIPDDYLPADYQSPSFRVKVEPARAATKGSFQPRDGGS